MKIKLPSVALAALLFAGLPLASSSAYIGISVGIAPPPIRVYAQPLCPVAGYMWTPGYWAYDGFDYYWVPGVWVPPPRIGVYWTPGYWGYDGSRYVFNEGYWGPTVGFYGGINYGFGYFGQGYYGGEWVGQTFRYNTAVTRVDTRVVRNTYVNRAVLRNNTGSRASFNGPGGATAKATAREQAAAKAEHLPPTPEQRSRVEAAKSDPALRVANNHGKPRTETVRAFDRKSATQTAAAGSLAGAKKAKAGAAQEANGHSAFGHRQGDATTRTRGSQNNVYGKAQSAQARSRGAAKAARTNEAVAPRAPAAVRMKSNSHANNAATTPRAAQRAQRVSNRPQRAATRRAAPAVSDHAKGQKAQPDKKKKPANERPGGGQ